MSLPADAFERNPPTLPADWAALQRRASTGWPSG